MGFGPKQQTIPAETKEEIHPLILKPQLVVEVEEPIAGTPQISMAALEGVVGVEPRPAQALELLGKETLAVMRFLAVTQNQAAAAGQERLGKQVLQTNWVMVAQA